MRGVGVIEINGTMVRPQLSMDQLKQGAFPRTAAAGDKDKLPLAYYQIDIFYRSNPSIFLLIIFADLFQAYFRHKALLFSVYRKILLGYHPNVNENLLPCGFALPLL